MAQSNNTGSILTRNELIKQAFLKAGLLGEGNALTAQQIIDGQNSLTALTYHYINKGLKIWKESFSTLFLVQGTNKYSVGTTARCVESPIETSIDGIFDAVSTVTVLDSTGMTIGDQFGILQGTAINWFAIVNVTSNDIELDSNVSELSDNQVYTYTDTISKPMNIDQAMVADLIDDTETELTLYARDEYFALNNKKNQGRPYNYYPDRQLDRIDVYLYSTPSTSQNAIRFSYRSPLFITDSAADQMDFPIEYSQLLIYALADEVCLEYGVDDMTTQRVSQRKQVAEIEAFAFDNEPASVFLSPNTED
jgi:hypothetical protein